MKQGQRDVEHARRVLECGDFEWACFAAQQGAEKVVRSVFQKLGKETSGHAVSFLIKALPKVYETNHTILEAAKKLDKHYIPSRYPTSFPQGAPFEYYTEGEASHAIEDAARIVAYCASLLARPRTDDPANSENNEGNTGETR